MTGKEYADKEYKDLNEGMKGIIARAFEAGLKQHEHDYLIKTKKIRNEYEAQIEKMKRHANCKHCDSEGYCEVKRTYLMDLSYDGCDKWELED